MTGPRATGPSDLGEVTRIAVLRANRLGDYLLAEPALAALRAAAPWAHILLIGSAWHVTALQDRPSPVDEVVESPPWKGVREPVGDEAGDPGATAAFFEAMRAREFDLAIQLHGGGGNSNPFVARLGAGWSIGLQDRGAPGLDACVRYEYWQHEVFRYLEVMALVGAPPVRIRPLFTATAQDHEAADQESRRVGQDPSDPLAVIHPGASDPRRRWPAERFAEVGRELRAAGAQVVVIGEPAEAALGARVAQLAGVADLTGVLSFSALVGLLHRACLVVANDSGPRHLAEALGTPTVSIYWFGNLATVGPVQRHRHRVHVSWTIACPVCGHPCVGDPPPRCVHDVSFVEDVASDEVVASALQVYSRSAADGVRGLRSR